MVSIFRRVWNVIRPPPLKEGLQNIKTGLPTLAEGAGVVLSAIPITRVGTGVARGIGAGVSKGYKGVAGLIARETRSPIITQGLKKGIGTIGKRVAGYGAGGLLGGLGGATTYLAISGKPITPMNILRAGLTGVGFGLSKVGGAVGVLGGTTENIITGVSATKVPPINVTPPQIPNIPSGSFGDIGDIMPTINLTSPTGVPTMINTPAFSPSISTGGGMDYTPLILALLAGGALTGYAIGRRRKKKRFKKKKKYK